MKAKNPVKKPVHSSAPVTLPPGTATAPVPRRRGRRLRAVAAVAVPVFLVAGCFGSDDEDSSGSDSASETSAAPSPSPVKFKELPDPCKSLAKKTVEDVVPKASDENGKKLTSEDADAYGACLWTGRDDYDYRVLSVSMRRFDSDTTLGSGDKRAKDHAAEQRKAISDNDENKGITEKKLEGVGQSATSISFDSTKKDGDQSQQYRAHHVVVTHNNVVLTVEYSGTGLEDAKNPSADTVRKAAEKVTKEALTAIK